MGVVTLDQVENQIARGFRYLLFSPEIEALFRKEYAAERVRLAVIWGVIGVFIYDLVYFGDRTMLPDVFSELLVARFLVFTPLSSSAVSWPCAAGRMRFSTTSWRWRSRCWASPCRWPLPRKAPVPTSSSIRTAIPPPFCSSSSRCGRVSLPS
ncbi:hypothetical protein [Ensifer sp. 22460]|uniref:hypothetical protein n=1 Tax=Ensifer sp. 22460 TaxID=3453922 RepID=UPI003F87BF4C